MPHSPTAEQEAILQALRDSQTKLTKEYLDTILRYDPNSGNLYWKIGMNNNVRAGDIAGAMSGFYIQISINGVNYSAHKIIWTMLYGNWPEHKIDHKDKNGWNNKQSNLREATDSQNGANRNRSLNNTSGYKGVSWHKTNCRWVAQIRFKGKLLHLGSFTTIKDAAKAYDKKALELFSEFASLNFKETGNV